MFGLSRAVEPSREPEKKDARSTQMLRFEYAQEAGENMPVSVTETLLSDNVAHSHAASDARWACASMRTRSLSASNGRSPRSGSARPGCKSTQRCSDGRRCRRPRRSSRSSILMNRAGRSHGRMPREGQTRSKPRGSSSCALERLPDIAVFHYNLACYECQLGNLEAAKERLALAFRLEPGFRVAALEDRDLEPLWESL